MTGFLPLIEAFLAFALTMLALATAVSAIVGMWMRVFRWRASGLRQSLELIYDKEIRPRLSAAMRATPSATTRLGFIADMTSGLDLETGPGKDEVRDRRIEELRTYVVEPASGKPNQQAASFLVRRYRRWHSLRFGLDHLSESQFQLRLEASQVGTALSNHHGEEEWEGLKSYLTRVFSEVGVTATETFARRSRVRTVIAGLVLAIGLNIDSFDLLNTYMTAPEVRRGVIALQEQILQQQVPDMTGVGASEGAVRDYGHTVEAAMVSIEQRLSELTAERSLDTAERQVLEDFRSLLGGLRSDLTAVAAVTDEVRAAVSTSRGLALQLTKSFPIGWDGYPNCYAAVLDQRCARISGRTLPTASPTGFRDRLLTVAQADTAGFLKWFLGVLITGFMVGLGAPFWVQAVNRILKLKEGPKVIQAAAAEERAPSSTAQAQSITRAMSPRQRPGGGQLARVAADDALSGRGSTARGPRPAATGIGQRARTTADDRLAARTPPGVGRASNSYR